MLMVPPNPFRENKLVTDRDYRPEWDVLELNAKTSAWLVNEVRRLEGRAEPDPGQMIAVMTGPPGYGKTHLFGRIEHQAGSDVFFVFVPAFEPETAPLDHIRRYAVAALFRKVADRPSLLELALARLCRPALADYFADLPPTLAARHDSLRQRLTESPAAVLEVIRSVKNLAPFSLLADSLVPLLPGDSAITRALALGWAPAPWSDIARRWLQGQELAESSLQEIGLGDKSPTALDVLGAIPALLGHKQPMIVCCDQLEGILQGSQAVDAGSILSQSLMDLLHKVPVQIVLSCFQDKLPELIKNFLAACRTRVRDPFRLETLKPDQAVRLVASRMASWPEHPVGKPLTWPFSEADIRQTIVDDAPTPRRLIQDCEPRFAEWLETDQRDAIPPRDRVGPLPPLDDGVAFLAEWNSEIAAIKSDPDRAVGQQAEDRLYRGVLEAIKLAHSAQRLRAFGGVRIVDVQDGVIRANAPARRPGARITLAGGPGEPAQSVIVALTITEAATSFYHYFNALKAQSDPVAGALLIHPRRDLNLGNNTRILVQEEQRKGRLRLLALEDHPLTFLALEAFVALLDRAQARELILNGATKTREDCRDLVIKTGVIDNLDLFKLLGHAKKPAPKPAEAAASPASSTAGAQRPSGPADVTGKSVAAAGPTSPAPSVAQAAGKAESRVAPPPPSVQPAPPPAGVDHSAWAAEKLAQAVKKLKLLGQDVEPDGFEIGPTFARLRVVPLGKTNFQVVKNKAVDLRISLGLKVVPIVGSQAGCISIDIQRPDRATVSLAEALAEPPAGLRGTPAFAVGADVAGQVHWLNLAEPADCHLLVAGTTGSGKSEFLRAAVAALARRLGPDQVQFVLIDPKRVTFNLAAASPYFRAPVAHDVDEALPLIQECMDEMDRRYAILEKHKLTNVADLASELVPRIVVVIDEFASFLEDKQSKKLVTALLKRIGAMARAAGIHLILATQRPDKDVITPVLRENLPGRIALQVTNKAGSELILGSPEAEHLLGKGDLFWKKGGELLRLQSPYVAHHDLEAALRINPT